MSESMQHVHVQKHTHMHPLPPPPFPHPHTSAQTHNCSVRAQYLAAVAPTLLGGVSTAKRASQPPGAAPTQDGDNATIRLGGDGGGGGGGGGGSRDALASGNRNSSSTEEAGDGIGTVFPSAPTDHSDDATPNPTYTTIPSTSTAVNTIHASSAHNNTGTSASNLHHTQPTHTAQQPGHASSAVNNTEKHACVTKSSEVEGQAVLRSVACGPPMWGGLRLTLLESALSAARQTNNARDVWEVCGAMLRCVCVCKRVCVHR